MGHLTRVPMFTAVLLVSGMACTTLAPENDDYCTLFHCGADGPVPIEGGGGSDGGTVISGEWDCLGATPNLPSTAPPVVEYVVPIVDFATPPTALLPGVPVIKGLNVVACGTGDPDCNNPSPTNASMPEADAGLPFVYGLQLAGGADLFLYITAPNYIPTRYYFLGPLVGSQDGGIVIQGAAIPPLTLKTATDLEAGGMISLDPTKGILALRAVDCNGQRAAYISVRLTASSAAFGGRGFTLINNLPFFADPPEPTDPRGVAGFANISSGNVQVYGVLPDGRTYGDAVVHVEPNELTVADLRPATVVPQ